MSIRVTITKPNVTNAYGLPLTVGTTYTVDDDFGLSLISQGKASDTDASLTNPGVREADALGVVYCNASTLAAPTAQMLASYNTVFALDVAPFTPYKSNGTTLIPVDAGYTRDASGNITGLAGAASNNPFPLGANGAIQRPYRIAAYGDSRAAFMTTATIMVPTGSATGLNPARTATWLAGALGDCELVANYGVSGDLAQDWASSSRANSKTINNLIAANVFKGGPVDAVYIQYGINDLINAGSPSTLAATLAGYLKAVCGAFMSSGIKVIFESINPASAAVYGSNAAAKLQATIDTNTLMQAWLAGFPRQAVFVDTFSQLVDGTGYASSTYITDGTHFGRLGAQLSGTACATAARAILPKKWGLVYTSGSLLQPNLIDWSGPTFFTVTEAGTVTATTPTWNIDTVTGLPYAEVTFTPTVLSAGTARARLEIHATTVSGAGARFPLVAGDELQGSAYVTADNGTAGTVPSIDNLYVRHRLYSDSKFSDDGQVIGAAGTPITQTVVRRYCTPTFFTATASASISAVASGAGYPLQVVLEFSQTGTPVRLRVYAPSLRVVSAGGGQPSQPAAGASPYTYTNNTGTPVMLYVAGGTVSSITIARQGAALTTGFTAGAFRLAQNDSVTITYTVAPTLTLVPDEAR